MSKVALLDFEATGVDPEKARPIEIGVALLDTEKNVILEEYSEFIDRHDYEPLSEEVQEVTGITDDLIKAKGESYEKVIEVLHPIMETADYMAAHNASYDRKVYGYECLRLEIKPIKRPWICTMRDIRWPKKFRCKQLSHMAVDLGVPMDERKLHRALDDTLLMKDLIEYSDFTWGEIIEYYEKPKVVIQAQVPKPFGRDGDGGVGKDAAKAQGYNWCAEWDGITYDMMWTKQVPMDEFEQEKDSLDYPIKIVRE